jgi:hypothetical protein
MLAWPISTWCAYRSGRAAGVFDFARQENARFTGEAESIKTVIGVDLGQSKEPTSIAVVQRVPASRLEERPDRPRRKPPLI